MEGDKERKIKRDIWERRTEIDRAKGKKEIKSMGQNRD